MTPDIFQIRDRLHFPAWLTENGLTGRGVEVGVLFGEYSHHLLGYWPGHLTMVDPWVNQDQRAYRDGCNAVYLPDAEATARAAVKEHGERATLLRMFSEQAAPLFEDGSLDFVFIDANHKASEVGRDISWWLPKIRHGGVLSGHDFYERHDAYQDCGVKTAVQDFARVNDLTVHLTPCTSWFILKP
jgi:hypothetical protein